MLRNYKKITDRVFHAVVVSRETMVDTPMDYASSGVDIDAEGAAVASLVGALSTSIRNCLLYTSPSPRDGLLSRMPSSA